MMRRYRTAVGVFAFCLGIGPVLVGAAIGVHAADQAGPLASLGLKASDFGGPIDNPFFTLTPGTNFYYVGKNGGVPSTSFFAVTSTTKTIAGVTVVEVHDSGYLNGSLEEFTLDWFAQDKKGNAWYFGEFTTQIKDGVVQGHVGSWQAGRDGALPGIIMEAHPKVGDTYDQEKAAPVAADAATVVSLNASVTVPFGVFTHVLKTRDFSRLHSDKEVEFKFYAMGVGLLRTETRGSASTDFSNLVLILGN